MPMESETREEIAEKVHNIMDILREHPDEVLSYRCEQLLDRIDTLAAADMED